MITLAATTSILKFKLGAAVVTNELEFTCSYANITSSTFGSGNTTGVSNGETPVTIAPAPLAANASRQIKSFMLNNTDSVTAQVTIIYDDNGTLREVFSIALASGDNLTYEDGAGWFILSPLGAVKNVTSIEAGGSANQVLYNNAGVSGGVSGTTTNGASVTFSTGNLIGADLKAAASGGGNLKSFSGTNCLLWGAGDAAGGSLYGNWIYDAATANTLTAFDSSKNLVSLALATYPSLAEISYVKGVTSAIQTQIDSKLSSSTAVSTYIPLSYLDTDGSLTANSDTKIATQKATKAYADAKVADAINNSVTTIAPSQNAVFDALALKLDTSTAASTYVPLTRTVNGHALTADVTVSKSDVGLGSVDNVQQLPMSYLDIDTTLAANSDTRVPSQKAIKAYADSLIAANDVMVFKGVIDASTNPNYPAADAGWTYRISVAGKIGGASGINVQVGDLILCLTDGTASGNQATVGANWSIAQVNIDGAVIGPASASDSFFPLWDGTSGTLLKNSSYSPSSFILSSWVDTDGTLAANSDSKIATQKAVKTYIASTSQPLDATLTAIAAYNTNGLFTQTAPDTFVGRTLTGTSNRITITNGDGVSGNPTVDIHASYVGQSSITTLGTIGTGVWQGSSISTTYTDAKIKTVTGTTNRLTIGGTATDPTFDISTSYAGQNTIVTLGTITTGTWNAGVIGGAYGGTGVNNGSSTITIGGNITFSGAYTFTATLTANTSVSFAGGGTVAYIGTKQAFTKQQNFGSASLTSTSAHIAWNLDDAQTAKHTFTENTTLDNPSNMVDGGTYILKFTQHASSPKTLAWGSAYKWAGGAAPTISSTNSAVDILTCVSDGTNMYCSLQKDFA